MSKRDDNSNLQRACNAIVEHSIKWQLPLNIAKTSLLHLGSSNRKRSLNLSGNTLVAKDTVRDLGFHIDTEMKFSQHAIEISSKANSVAHSLFRALRSKNPLTLKTAYEVYVRPILEYGTTVSNPYQKKDITILEKVQNAYTRKIFRRCHGKTWQTMPDSSSRNESLSLGTLRERRQKTDMKLLGKLVFGFTRLSTKNNHFYKIAKSRLRGHSFRLNFPAPATNYRKNSFFIRSSLYFNEMARKHPELIPNIACD